MTTQLANFDLSGLDMAFVISQANLNVGLGEFLDGLGLQFTFAYDISGGKCVPPQNADNPAISFTGWLTNDQSMTTVDMSTENDNNMVTLNLFFEDATFVNNLTGATFTATGTTQWQVPLSTPLVFPTATGTPPTSYVNLQNQYGDIFSLQQIMLDLTAAVPSASQVATPLGPFDSVSWAFLLLGMSTYLNQNSQTLFGGGPVQALAYAASMTGQSEQVPTFTPTWADMILLSTGDPTTSGVAIAMMVQGHPNPQYPANDFSGASLIDPSCPAVAIVHSTLALPQLGQVLAGSNLGNVVAQFVVPSGTNDGTGDFTFATGSLSGQTLTAMPSPGVLASYSMSQGPQSTSDQTGSYSCDYTIQIVTTSSITVAPANGQIGINGTMTFSANGNSDYQGNVINWNTVTFNYDWFANFALQPIGDSGAGGGSIGLAYNSAGDSFPATYTSTSGGESGQPPSYSWTNYFSAALTQISSTIQNGLQGTISAAPLFVFPGGGDFTFESAGLTSLGALYSVIAYQNPG